MKTNLSNYYVNAIALLFAVSSVCVVACPKATLPEFDNPELYKSVFSAHIDEYTQDSPSVSDLTPPYTVQVSEIELLSGQRPSSNVINVGSGCALVRPEAGERLVFFISHSGRTLPVRESIYRLKTSRYKDKKTQ